ncbi:MAG: NeuD/PglB/VioB family sugar acetyltransferase [Gemmatimonadota bacterium]|nr:NeuD/PglB/VioB family sugar acetyltransferase [Gemmatimonadota bacterium]
MIIVGGGGFARELISWIQHGAPEMRKRIDGYLDDAGEQVRMPVPYLGTLSSYVPSNEDRFLCAIGNPAAKRSAVRCLKTGGARFDCFIHPSVIVVETATLGEGVIVGPYSVISNDVRIGDFVTLNSYCGAGHDSRIGAFSTLSAYIDVTGFAALGEEVFIGTHASILPRVKVGNRCRIGAGSVVMRNMAHDTAVYAPAAKRLK